MTPEQERNNPNHESVGPYTGRCANCHSNDLWDDETMYGCNQCGKWYSNRPVMLVNERAQHPMVDLAQWGHDGG